MKKVLIMILIFCLVGGCATLDSWIAPEKQCMLVKRGASTAIMIGLTKFKSKDLDKVKLHSKEIVSIIKLQILPILEKRNGKGILKEEWDKILGLLDKNLQSHEKLLIQQAILVLLQFAPIPDKNSKGFGNRFVYLAKCMFNGIIDGFSGYFSKEKSLTKEFKKMCKECELK